MTATRPGFYQLWEGSPNRMGIVKKGVILDEPTTVGSIADMRRAVKAAVTSIRKTLEKFDREALADCDHVMSQAQSLADFSGNPKSWDIRYLGITYRIEIRRIT